MPGGDDAPLDDFDIARRSHWLQQALSHDNDVLSPLADENTQADICIVGGGYLGLWSAIQLKASEPSLKIVLLEQDICGSWPERPATPACC